MTRLAEGLVAALADRGVRRAYTVPGESFLPLIDAFDRHPSTTLVSTRHESGASFMAEADAKLTGVPAVAMATRAVGAANLAIGVHTAYQDSTPMIVLLGQVETPYLGREAFQEVDLPAFYREITVWAQTVTESARLPEALDRAWHAATAGRPGPAMLALPADVLNGPASGGDNWRPGVATRLPGVLGAEDAGLIVSRMREARSPVIIAGGGAQHAREELVELAELLGAGVYAAFRRQDVFANDHPHYCGHLSLATPPALLRPLREADAVLVLGSRLSEITTQSYTLPRPETWIAQLDRDPRSLGAVLPVNVAAAVDIAAAMGPLLGEARARGAACRDWGEAHAAYLAASTPAVEEGAPLAPQTVMALLARTFPPETIVTNDAGNFSVHGHRYWRFNHPRSQLGPTSGAMGYAVPAAVAAALADARRPVLALVGDGGFLMTGQEVETAVRHGADLTVVVFRNGLYGTIALHQARALGRTGGVDIGEVDVAAVARGYGAAAWRAESPAELARALAAARDHRGPAVVDAVVDPDVLTPEARLSGLLPAEGGRS